MRSIAMALGLALLSSTAWAQGTLNVASTLPLTGVSAWYGQQGRNGATMAMEEANAAGGVLGKTIAVDFLDNRCNPAEGVKSLTQALSGKPYTAVHDGGCSSVALAIMPLAERAGIPYVVASPSATSIAERSGIGGNKWIFKIIPTDAGMLSALVAWIDKAGQDSRVAFIGEDTDYGRGGAKAFDAALAKYGKALVNTDFYQQGTSDFTALFARVKANRPSLLAVYAVGADSQNFLQQWAEAGGGVGLTGRIFTDTVAPEIINSGVLNGLTTIHPYDIHLDTPENKAWVARYEARFKSLPNLTSWASYEALRVILEAARRAGTTEPGPVRDAIATGGFKTGLGDTITFDDHNLAHLDALVLGIKDGKVVLLGRSGT